MNADGTATESAFKRSLPSCQALHFRLVGRTNVRVEPYRASALLRCPNASTKRRLVVAVPLTSGRLESMITLANPISHLQILEMRLRKRKTHSNRNSTTRIQFPGFRALFVFGIAAVVASISSAHPLLTSRLGMMAPSWFSLTECWLCITFVFLLQISLCDNYVTLHGHVHKSTEACLGIRTFQKNIRFPRDRSFQAIN